MKSTRMISTRDFYVTNLSVTRHNTQIPDCGDSDKIDRYIDSAFIREKTTNHKPI